MFTRLHCNRSLSSPFLIFSSFCDTKATPNSEFIKNLLVIDDKDWNEGANKILNNVEQNRINDTYNLLQKLGYTNEDIKSEPLLLSKHPLIIKNRFQIYYDYFIRKKNIKISLLRHFPSTFSKSIHQLKYDGYIDKHKDVFDHINKKYNLDTSQSILNETMILRHIHFHYTILFYMQKLDMTYEQANYNYQKYVRLTNRSLKSLEINVEFLKQNLNFTNEKIHKHVYVLHIDKENVQLLLKKYPKLGTVDMKHYLYTYPNIMLPPVSTLVKVIECIQKYGYRLDDIQKAPLILLLNEKTVEDRLHFIHSEEWLKPYANLSRALTLVTSLKGIEKRYALLQDLNIKCMSVNNLSCPKDDFNEYVKHGRDRINSYDVFEYLSNKLKIPWKSIKLRLQTHPYQRYVSLQQIHTTVCYLLEEFCEDHIYESLQLVLYPVPAIRSALEKLKTNPNFDVTPCMDDSGQIKQNLILPLTLYLIEKENNFSGYGVWENETPENKLNKLEGDEEEIEIHLREDTNKVLHIPKRQRKKPWNVT